MLPCETSSHSFGTVLEPEKHIEFCERVEGKYIVNSLLKGKYTIQEADFFDGRFPVMYF